MAYLGHVDIGMGVRSVDLEPSSHTFHTVFHQPRLCQWVANSYAIYSAMVCQQE
jgi:hypothetical protein